MESNNYTQKVYNTLKQAGGIKELSYDNFLKSLDNESYSQKVYNYASKHGYIKKLDYDSFKSHLNPVQPADDVEDVKVNTDEEEKQTTPISSAHTTSDEERSFINRNPNATVGKFSVYGNPSNGDGIPVTRKEEEPWYSFLYENTPEYQYSKMAEEQITKNNEQIAKDKADKEAYEKNKQIPLTKAEQEQKKEADEYANSLSAYAFNNFRLAKNPFAEYDSDFYNKSANRNLDVAIGLKDPSNIQVPYSNRYRYPDAMFIDKSDKKARIDQIHKVWDETEDGKAALNNYNKLLKESFAQFVSQNEGKYKDIDEAIGAFLSSDRAKQLDSAYYEQFYNANKAAIDANSYEADKLSSAPILKSALKDANDDYDFARTHYNNEHTYVGRADLYNTTPSYDKDMLSNAEITKEQLEDANKLYEAATKQEGFWKGMENTITDMDTWFSLKGISDNIQIKKVAEKADKGEELTPSEAKLLDAVVINSAINAYYGGDISRWYKAGETTAASIPFMVEFALLPMTSGSTAVSRGIAKYAEKRFLKQGVKAAENYAKKKAIQMVGDLVGGLTVSGVKTLTVDMPKVLKNYSERELGTFNFRTEGDKLVYNGREDIDEGAGAFGRALFSQFNENFTEQAFTPLGRLEFTSKLGKMIPWMSNKIKYSDLNSFEKFLNGANQFRKDAHIGGLLEETAEEELNNLLNGIVEATGSDDFTKALEEEYGRSFSQDEQIDLILGLAPTQVLFGVGGTASYTANKIRERYDRKSVEKNFGKDFVDKVDKYHDDPKRLYAMLHGTIKEILNNNSFTTSDGTKVDCDTPEKKESLIRLLVAEQQIQMIDLQNKVESENNKQEENATETQVEEPAEDAQVVDNTEQVVENETPAEDVNINEPVNQEVDAPAQVTPVVETPVITPEQKSTSKKVFVNIGGQEYQLTSDGGWVLDADGNVDIAKTAEEHVVTYVDDKGANRKFKGSSLDTTLGMASFSSTPVSVETEAERTAREEAEKKAAEEAAKAPVQTEEPAQQVGGEVTGEVVNETPAQGVNGEPAQQEPKYPVKKNGKPDIENMNEHQRYQYAIELLKGNVDSAKNFILKRYDAIKKSIQDAQSNIQNLQSQLESVNGTSQWFSDMEAINKNQDDIEKYKQQLEELEQIFNEQGIELPKVEQVPVQEAVEQAPAQEPIEQAPVEGSTQEPVQPVEPVETAQVEGTAQEPVQPVQEPINPIEEPAKVDEQEVANTKPSNKGKKKKSSVANTVDSDKPAWYDRVISAIKSEFGYVSDEELKDIIKGVEDAEESDDLLAIAKGINNGTIDLSSDKSTIAYKKYSKNPTEDNRKAYVRAQIIDGIRDIVSERVSNILSEYPLTDMSREEMQKEFDAIWQMSGMNKPSSLKARQDMLAKALGDGNTNESYMDSKQAKRDAAKDAEDLQEKKRQEKEAAKAAKDAEDNALIEEAKANIESVLNGNSDEEYVILETTKSKYPKHIAVPQSRAQEYIDRFGYKQVEGSYEVVYNENGEKEGILFKNRKAMIDANGVVTTGSRIKLDKLFNQDGIRLKATSQEQTLDNLKKEYKADTLEGILDAKIDINNGVTLREILNMDADAIRNLCKDIYAKHPNMFKNMDEETAITEIRDRIKQDILALNSFIGRGSTFSIGKNKNNATRLNNLLHPTETMGQESNQNEINRKNYDRAIAEYKQKRMLGEISQEEYDKKRAELLAKYPHERTEEEKAKLAETKKKQSEKAEKKQVEKAEKKQSENEEDTKLSNEEIEALIAERDNINEMIDMEAYNAEEEAVQQKRIDEIEAILEKNGVSESKVNKKEQSEKNNELDEDYDEFDTGYSDYDDSPITFDGSHFEVGEKATDRNEAVTGKVVDALERAGVRVKMVSAEDVEDIIGSENADVLRANGADGRVLGFHKGNTIYLVKENFGTDTPIHEYTHVFLEAYKKAHPAEYAKLVDALKQLPEWDKMKNNPDYQGLLRSDDDVASEVLAHYSGKRGAERLSQKIQEEAANGNNESADMWMRVKNAIKNAWEWVKNSFGKKGINVDDFCDMMLDDLLEGKIDIDTNSESNESVSDSGNIHFSVSPMSGTNKTTEQLAESLSDILHGKNKAIQIIQEWQNGYIKLHKVFTYLNEARVKAGLKALSVAKDLETIAANVHGRANGMLAVFDTIGHKEEFKKVREEVEKKLGLKAEDAKEQLDDYLMSRSMNERIDELREEIRRVLDAGETPSTELVNQYKKAIAWEKSFVDKYGKSSADFISEFEDKIDTKELWNKINKATAYLREQAYRVGWLSAEEKAKQDKRKYYVPNRNSAEMFSEEQRKAFKDKFGLKKKEQADALLDLYLQHSEETDGKIIKKAIEEAGLSDVEVTIGALGTKPLKEWRSKLLMQMIKDNLPSEMKDNFNSVATANRMRNKGMKGVIMMHAKGRASLAALPIENLEFMARDTFNGVAKAELNLKLLDLFADKFNAGFLQASGFNAIPEIQIDGDLVQDEAKIKEYYDMLAKRDAQRKEIADGTREELDDEIKDYFKRVKYNKLKNADNTFFVKHNGITYQIAVPSQEVLDALNSNFGKEVKGVSAVKNYVSKMVTTYNPAFGASNFVKDLQANIAWLSADDPYVAKKFVNVLKMIREKYDVIKFLMTGKFWDDEYGQYMKEFIANGGEGGYSFEYIRKDTLENKMKDELTGKGTLSKVKDKAQAVLSLPSQIGEMLNRFAVYVAARQSDKTEEEAMYYSKNANINMDIKARKKEGASGEIAKYFYTTIPFMQPALTAFGLRARKTLGDRNGAKAGSKGNRNIYWIMGGIALLMLEGLWEAWLEDDDDDEDVATLKDLGYDDETIDRYISFKQSVRDNYRTSMNYIIIGKVKIPIEQSLSVPRYIGRMFWKWRRGKITNQDYVNAIGNVIMSNMLVQPNNEIEDIANIISDLASDDKHEQFQKQNGDATANALSESLYKWAHEGKDVKEGFDWADVSPKTIREIENLLPFSGWYMPTVNYLVDKATGNHRNEPFPAFTRFQYTEGDRIEKRSMDSWVYELDKYLDNASKNLYREENWTGNIGEIEDKYYNFLGADGIDNARKAIRDYRSHDLKRLGRGYGYMTDAEYMENFPEDAIEEDALRKETFYQDLAPLIIQLMDAGEINNPNAEPYKK